MYTFLLSRHRLLQVSSESVKGLSSLQPFSKDVRKEVSPTDPGVKPFSAIPGPPSLPIIGTLWDYYRGTYNLQKPYETYSKFLKNYGPLVKEKVFFGQTLVHVFNPRDQLNIYKSEKNSLPIRHSHTALKKYRESKRDLYGHIGVAPSNGKEWNGYRSLFMDVFEFRTVLLALEEITEDLIEYMKSNLDHNGEIPVFPALYYYTLESIGDIILGKRMGCFEQDRRAEVTRFIQAVHDSHYAIHQTEHKPYILARKAYKTLEISQDHIADFVREQMNYISELMQQESEVYDPEKSDASVTEERKSGSTRPSESFLYVKLKKGLSKSMILPMAVDFFQGGVHSTAHSLAFALYNLALNPDKQEIFREELIKIFPNKTDIIANGLQLSSYSAQIISETLRLNPPTIGTGRVLGKDLVLSGYLVPKGTKVILHHEVASKQEDNFPDPLKFIPGRKRINIASNPFIETSKRMCMGNVVARLEMRMALMKIFRRFEVSYHYEKVGVVNYLINEPDRPIKLRLKEIS